MNSYEFARCHCAGIRSAPHCVNEFHLAFSNFKQTGTHFHDVSRKQFVQIFCHLVYCGHAPVVLFHVAGSDAESRKENPCRLIEHRRIILNVHVLHVVDVPGIHYTYEGTLLRALQGPRFSTSRITAVHKSIFRRTCPPSHASFCPLHLPALSEPIPLELNGGCIAHGQESEQSLKTEACRLHACGNDPVNFPSIS